MPLKLSSLTAHRNSALPTRLDCTIGRSQSECMSVRGTALMLAFLSFIVLGFRAGSPTRMIYDEPYYVPAARALLSGTPSNLNPEAPPMGKLMIAAGIRLFGDTPFGWRFFGV